MATSFAKVILFGEHAVVHGRVAVAAALDRGARGVAQKSDVATLTLRPFERVVRADDDDDIARGFAAVLATLGVPPHEVTVDVDVPGGAGLGCSAAIGVAIARAIGEASGTPLDDDTAAAAANAWERIFHGNPSGVDVAVASRGGVIVFRKGEPPRRIVPAGVLELAVAYTGEPSSTRQMVDAVARQLARRPTVVERTFDGIETLALKGAGAIETGRMWEIGQLMDLNHALLASLMVSTEALERVCNVARGAGAVGAKLTGGGGGGCAIALAPGKVDAVLEAWRSIGIEGFSARIGAELAR